MGPQSPWIAKAILRKKNKFGGIMFTDFKLYYKLWSWHKNRHIDQWNRMESSEIKLCLYDPSVYDKGGKIIHWSDDSLFNKGCWENWTASGKEWNWTIKLYTKINSKSIKDLNIKREAIKLLEEKIGSKLFNISLNTFLISSPTARTTKAQINKLDFHKPKSFGAVKKSMSETKSNQQNRRYPQVIYTIRDSHPKYINNS